MDEQKIRDFTKRYESLDESVLASIHDKQSDLVDEARVALAEVVSRRGIDFEVIREEAKKEYSEYARKTKIITDKKRARDSKITKILLIISIPFFVIGMFVQPNTTLRLVVAVIIQGAALVLFWWLIVAVKRFLKRPRD